MKKLKAIDHDYLFILCLVAVMGLIKISDVILSPNHIYPGRTAVFSVIEIGLVLVLGLIGSFLSKKSRVLATESKENLIKSKLQPFLLGMGWGIIFVMFDYFWKIGDMSVGWPLSPVFYVWGGISQEVMSHFFPMSLFVFIFSYLILKKKYQDQVYWVGAVLMSLLGSVGMMAAFQNPDISLEARYSFVPLGVGILVFMVEIFILQILKKYGLKSALCARLGFYTIWHVVWPLVFYS